MRCLTGQADFLGASPIRKRTPSGESSGSEKSRNGAGAADAAAAPAPGAGGAAAVTMVSSPLAPGLGATRTEPGSAGGIQMVPASGSGAPRSTAPTPRARGHSRAPSGAPVVEVHNAMHGLPAETLAAMGLGARDPGARVESFAFNYPSKEET
jgi:hypothetical protein